MTRTATDAFIERKAEIDAQIARIQGLSKGFFNVSPEGVNWSHVGMLDEYAKLLKRITDAAFNEGEHAK